MKRHLSILAVIAVISLLVGVVGGLLYAQLGGGTPPVFAADSAPQEPTPLLMSAEAPIATPKPTFTPLVTPTLARQPIPLQPMGQPVAAPAAPVATTPPVEPLRFTVIADEIYLAEGPGSAYPSVAVARRGAELVVTGRSADGIWWQLCCMDDRPLWMRLDAQDVRADGDVTTVPILEIVVYNLEPTPPPPPPPPGAAPAAPQAPVSIAAAPPPAAPQPTPLPKGDPACSTGISYPTIPVLGAPRSVPAAQDPEINLALRGYVPTPGFLQKIGMGGHTDPHAPQFGTLFGDRRIPKDFPTVYTVRQWNWACNCPGGPIGNPDVTALGISSRPGELLHTPTRTQGDIGGGYRAMVLYATPNSLTLKYTREDDMLFGYGLHIDGICVAPELLARYYEMNAAGRKALPVLRGGDPIGRAQSDTVRLAVRDTGQFMDPRSEKDWWVEGTKVDGMQ